MSFPSPDDEQRSPPKRLSNPFFTLLLLLFMLVIGYKLISQDLYRTEIMSHPFSTMLEQTETTPPTTNVPNTTPSTVNTEAENVQEPEQVWIHYTVKRKDKISKIFQKLQLDPEDLLEIMKLDSTHNLKKLYLGQKLDFLVSTNPDPQAQYKILRAIHLKLNARQTLIIKAKDGKFTHEIYQQPIDVQTKIATATIDNSFLTAGAKAGIPSSILKQIIALFSSRIDFKHDVHKGDSFTVAYEEEFLEGKLVKTGGIVAVKFVNKGITNYALRYKTRSGEIGYFNSNGASVRQGFLRRPINGGRISSPFSLGRKHPILGYVRRHTGTDFAAAYGTPIHATANGRVLLAGRKGGYGRCVMISHGSHIVTLYGHMSRYATGLKAGNYVKQGQVIGYIGTSGLATGPHVHYEFRINNKFYNPMTVRLPNAAPVPRKELKHYIAWADNEIDKLNAAHIAKTI